MKFYLCILFVVFFIETMAQQVNIEPMINDWKNDGPGQTMKSRVYTEYLRQHNDTALYYKNITGLNNYLKHNPDTRLKVRTIMYEVTGGIFFQLKPFAAYTPVLQKALTMAQQLKDEQLSSEIYALYAGTTPTAYDYLLYSLKAIEIQKKIGFQYFPDIRFRYYNVSQHSARVGDYRSGILYGTAGLNISETTINSEYEWLTVLQYDIIGYCYKKLNNYDSARFYYEQILKYLNLHKDKKKPYFKIFEGISKGNIGQALAKHQKFNEAMPMIEEYVNVSTAENDSLNIAMAENALGTAFFAQKNYTGALKSWQHAWWVGKNIKATEEMMTAAEGLGKIYRLNGNTDSGYYYYDQYHLYKSLLLDSFKNKGIEKAKAQVAFDDLQKNLDKSELSVTHIKQTRNITLGGIILISIIIFLLLHRKRFLEKLKLEKAEEQKRLANAEVENAKLKIDEFVNQLIRKNNIIQSLEEKIIALAKSSKVLPENLLEYSLVSDEEWINFRDAFAKAYPLFLFHLNQKLAPATTGEERLSTLIYLKLNSYQIANTLGISRDSVARGKRRLTKRLGLPFTSTLEDYILALS